MSDEQVHHGHSMSEAAHLPDLTFSTGADRDVAAAILAAKRRRELVRARPRAYVDSERWNESTAIDRKLVRIRAVAADLADPVIVGRDAARVHGIPLLGHVEENVSILSRREGGSRRRGGITERRFALPLQVEEVDGIPVTSIVDTVLDVVRFAREEREGIVALDHVLRREMREDRDPESLRATIDARRREFGGGRGTASSKRLIAFADPLAESPLESISRHAIDRAGFPPPVLQKVWRLPGGRGARSDFYFEAANVIGEADGDAKYSLGPGSPEEAVLRAAKAERERDELLRALGPLTTHWTWADAWARTPLVTKLLRAGVRRR